MEDVGFRFCGARFREGICFRWCVFLWVLSSWVFLRCLFSGVPPIYDAYIFFFFLREYWCVLHYLDENNIYRFKKKTCLLFWVSKENLDPTRTY